MKVRARSNATMRPVTTGPDRPSPAFRSMGPAPAYTGRHFSKRIVDQLLDVACTCSRADGRVLQHDEEHVLGAVDHEVGAGRVVPFDFAGRTRRRRHCIAGIGADAEAIARPKPSPG